MEMKIKRNDMEKVDDLVKILRSTFEREIELAEQDPEFRRINVARKVWYESNIHESLSIIKGIVGFYDNVALLGVQPPNIIKDFKVILSDAEKSHEEYEANSNKVYAIWCFLKDLDGTGVAWQYQNLCKRTLREFGKHDLLKYFPETVKMLEVGSEITREDDVK